MAKCRRTLLNLLTLFWAASVSLVDPVAGRGLDPCPGGLCSPAAEPVLVFDRTGLLFAGDFNFHLTVYANGRAVASRSVAANVGVAPDTATGSDGSSEFAHVPPEVVTDLRRH